MASSSCSLADIKNRIVSCDTLVGSLATPHFPIARGLSSCVLLQSQASVIWLVTFSTALGNLAKPSVTTLLVQEGNFVIQEISGNVCRHFNCHSGISIGRLRPGILLNILQGTGQPHSHPTAKNSLSQSVSSVKVEQPNYRTWETLMHLFSNEFWACRWISLQLFSSTYLSIACQYISCPYFLTAVLWMVLFKCFFLSLGVRHIVRL